MTFIHAINQTWAQKGKRNTTYFYKMYRFTATLGYMYYAICPLNNELPVCATTKTNVA